MSGFKSGFLVLVIFSVFFIQGLFNSDVASAGDQTSAKEPEKAVLKQKAVLYQPPRRGAPLTRVAGGSRGADSSTLSLLVLTPEHMGLTRQAQPVLYWYTSKPIYTRFEFALLNDGNYQTVVETNLEVASRAGIHSVSLKELGVKLMPDTPYQWSIAIVTDENHRSGDVFASGMIKRINSKAVSPAPSSEEDAVFRYAEQGLWYDALNAVSELIAKHPENEHFIKQRIGLFKQAGLSEVAAFEMKRSP